MSRPLHILLAGYYGFANAGDEIVLAGIQKGLASISGTRPFEIRALSGFPAHTGQVHGIRAYPRFSPAGLIAALVWADCLVLGGGSLIQDATSRRSALYYLWLTRIAQMLGRKTFLWAQGFGPLEAPELRNLARRVLSKASAITVRDPASRNELRGLGVPERLLALSADPAFLVDPSEVLRSEPFFQASRNVGGLFGVSLRSWPAIERAEGDVAQACKAFTNAAKLGCFLIPFQQPQDAEISNRVAARCGVEAAVLSARPSPREMIRLFQELTLVMGMRLHSLILAARSAVPFVGLSYDPKVERFCQAARMPCLTIAQLQETDVLRLLLEVYESREIASCSLRDFARQQSELALKSAELFWQCLS